MVRAKGAITKDPTFRAVFLFVDSIADLSVMHRGRAWIRHALNGNKLAHLFRVLTDDLKFLAKWYKPYALLRFPELFQRAALILDSVTPLKFELQLNNPKLFGSYSWKLVGDDDFPELTWPDNDPAQGKGAAPNGSRSAPGSQNGYSKAPTSTVAAPAGHVPFRALQRQRSHLDDQPIAVLESKDPNPDRSGSRTSSHGSSSVGANGAAQVSSANRIVIPIVRVDGSNMHALSAHHSAPAVNGSTAAAAAAVVTSPAVSTTAPPDSQHSKTGATAALSGSSTSSSTVAGHDAPAPLFDPLGTSDRIPPAATVKSPDRVTASAGSNSGVKSQQQQKQRSTDTAQRATAGTSNGKRQTSGDQAPPAAGKRGASGASAGMNGSGRSDADPRRNSVKNAFLGFAHDVKQNVKRMFADDGEALSESTQFPEAMAVAVAPAVKAVPANASAAATSSTVVPSSASTATATVDSSSTGASMQLPVPTSPASSHDAVNVAASPGDGASVSGSTKQASVESITDTAAAQVINASSLSTEMHPAGTLSAPTAVGVISAASLQTIPSAAATETKSSMVPGSVNADASTAATVPAVPAGSNNDDTRSSAGIVSPAATQTAATSAVSTTSKAAKRRAKKGSASTPAASPAAAASTTTTTTAVATDAVTPALIAEMAVSSSPAPAVEADTDTMVAPAVTPMTAAIPVQDGSSLLAASPAQTVHSTAAAILDPSSISVDIQSTQPSVAPIPVAVNPARSEEKAISPDVTIIGTATPSIVTPVAVSAAAAGASIPVRLSKAARRKQAASKGKAQGGMNAAGGISSDIAGSASRSTAAPVRTAVLAAPVDDEPVEHVEQQSASHSTATEQPLPVLSDVVAAPLTAASTLAVAAPAASTPPVSNEADDDDDDDPDARRQSRADAITSSQTQSTTAIAVAAATVSATPVAIQPPVSPPAAPSQLTVEQKQVTQTTAAPSSPDPEADSDDERLFGGRPSPPQSTAAPAGSSSQREIDLHRSSSSLSTVSAVSSISSAAAGVRAAKPAPVIAEEEEEKVDIETMVRPPVVCSLADGHCWH